MRNRLRSSVLWAAILSLIVFVLKTYFGITIFEVDKLIDMVLLVCTLIGILNNPTDNTKF